MNNLITIFDIPAWFQLVVQSGTPEKNIFNSLVSEMQKRYLLKFLGAVEYAKLISDLANGEVQSQIYIDLINGADLIDNSLTWHFDGFKEILKYFVGAEFLRQMIARNTMTGSKEINSQQAKPDYTSIHNKIIKIFNSGVDLVGENINLEYKNKLTDFLFLNIETFDNLEFKPINKINLYGF